MAGCFVLAIAVSMFMCNDTMGVNIQLEMACQSIVSEMVMG